MFLLCVLGESDTLDIKSQNSKQTVLPIHNNFLSPMFHLILALFQSLCEHHFFQLYSKKKKNKMKLVLEILQIPSKLLYLSIHIFRRDLNDKLIAAAAPNDIFTNSKNRRR